MLGAIIFGLATPSEAAAIGALGALVLAVAYGSFTFAKLRESVILTARATAMVCWLFVGSNIFSSVFGLLGGQDVIKDFMLWLDLGPLGFMLLVQVIIFLLGWPLEWTEIIVIFVPIFLPLLQHFGIDPLFFGLMVALNIQTSFLSPPVAMAGFYPKGVSPPHVTINQIFAGMMPFMFIVIIAMALLYIFPEIGMWLPSVLYGGPRGLASNRRGTRHRLQRLDLVAGDLGDDQQRHGQQQAEDAPIHPRSGAPQPPRPD